MRDKVADWKVYPFSIPAITQLERLELDPAVTFLVGENGSGKSTLIEAIAIRAGFNPEGGTKNFRSTHRPSESSLQSCVRMARGARREKGGFFLRAETMFNVSTEAEQYRAYGWADLHEMSHGEAFLWVAVNKFQDGGLVHPRRTGGGVVTAAPARAAGPHPSAREVRKPAGHLHALADSSRLPEGDHLPARSRRDLTDAVRRHRALRGDESFPSGSGGEGPEALR
jgi:hypothetical protein